MTNRIEMQLCVRPMANAFGSRSKATSRARKSSALDSEGTCPHWAASFMSASEHSTVGRLKKDTRTPTQTQTQTPAMAHRQKTQTHISRQKCANPKPRPQSRLRDSTCHRCTETRTTCARVRRQTHIFRTKPASQDLIRILLQMVSGSRPNRCSKNEFCLHLTHKTLLHDTMTRKTDDGGCDLYRRTATQSEFALNDRSATQACQEGNGQFLTQNWCKDALRAF